MGGVEGNLGVLTLKKKKDIIKTTDVSSDKQQFSDKDKVADLGKKFEASEAGKKMKISLEAIKNDATLSVEQKKEKLVVFMKDFFGVDTDSDQEHVQRFVDDTGKSWLRITMVDKNEFDISLEGDNTEELITSFIDRSLERSTQVVNEGQTEDAQKITLKYEKDKLVIEDIQKDLDALKAQVAQSNSPAGTTPSSGTSRRDRVKDKRNNLFAGKATFDDFKGTVAGRFKSNVALVTGALGTVASVLTAFGGKDSAKSAESTSKLNEAVAKVNEFGNTVLVALGFGDKPAGTTTTSEQPSSPQAVAGTDNNTSQTPTQQADNSISAENPSSSRTLETPVNTPAVAQTNPAASGDTDEEDA